MEQLLRDIVEASEPPDLRDRVQGERAKAVEDALTWRIGKSLTLFWDDPERPPLPI
jgi:hypothetical protein